VNADVAAGWRVELCRVQLDAERYLGLEVVVDEHDERVSAGLAELEIVQREDLIRRNRLVDSTLWYYVALDLEHGLAVGIVETDLDVVRPITLGRMCLEPQDEMHLRMHGRDLIDADPVEDTEDVELALGGDVGVVRQQRELDLHRGSITRRCAVVNERAPGAATRGSARVSGGGGACAGASVCAPCGRLRRPAGRCCRAARACRSACAGTPRAPCAAAPGHSAPPGNGCPAASPPRRAPMPARRPTCRGAASPRRWQYAPCDRRRSAGSGAVPARPSNAPLQRRGARRCSPPAHELKPRSPPRARGCCRTGR